MRTAKIAKYNRNKYINNNNFAYNSADATQELEIQSVLYSMPDMHTSKSACAQVVIIAGGH